jgi:hypothetical protein
MRARWMRSASAALLLFAVGLAAGEWGCRGSNTDCTCVVENNGQRRTLVCGESACVGETTVTCAEAETAVFQGACTIAPAPGPPDSGAPINDPDAGTYTEPDRACADLLAFCNTSCRTPASASADCLTTATASDSTACSQWALTNGVLCHP